MFCCKKKGAGVFNKREKKMNCIEISVLLSPYQDNELEGGLCKNVEKHLLVCENCRKELEELAGISRDIAEIRDIEPAENFTAVIMSAVKEHKEKKFSGKLACAYTFVFTLFFIFGVIIDPYSPGGSSENTIRPELSSVLLDGQKFTSEYQYGSVIIELAGGKDEKRDN